MYVLEEPVAPVLTILTATNVNQILPTIRSRVQIVNVAGETVETEAADTAELTEINDLTEKLYQQLIDHNTLSILTAKQLADSAKQKELQSYALDQLLRIADANMQDMTNFAANQTIFVTSTKNQQYAGCKCQLLQLSPVFNLEYRILKVKKHWWTHTHS